MEHPVIQRYLSPAIWDTVKKDFTLKRLVGLINTSGGEYSLQLREDYFNIYYQGNSLAKVIPNKNGTYSAVIHKEFLRLDKPDKIVRKLMQYSSSSETPGNTGGKNKYRTFKIHLGKLYHFFQSNHLKSLGSNIRAVHAGEEITFEQVLITDNPPSNNFIIIDRQVADHRNKAQMDLLALKRASVDKPFHFVVIELKLGKNPELHEKVGNQLNTYVKHIKKFMKDYVDCYKENYRQKKQLGLLSSSLPNNIEIDENTVEGLIVVVGYSGLAEKALKNLCHSIKDNRWDIKVKQIRNEIKLDSGSDCDKAQ